MGGFETTCCFTGHRPSGLPWKNDELDPRCLDLRREIFEHLETIYCAGYRHFICGMALGCDTFFARAVIALKDDHPDITLEAAVPFAGQADAWSTDHRQEYEDILALCDKVTVLQNAYSPDCMMRRNRYMVDHSSLLLACFTGMPGGTMNTIVYAQRCGTEVDLIEIE